MFYRCFKCNRGMVGVPLAAHFRLSCPYNIPVEFRSSTWKGWFGKRRINNG
jgi:phage FluMu protein Com